MKELDGESIHLIVTSPPYWQLKDYGSDRQIGFNETYENYINNLNLVWTEAMRVLKPGCRLCINIGDQFARAVYYGRYKVIPIRTEIIKFCEMIGFDYMGSVIWQKVTTTNTTGGASIMGSFPYPRNGILKLDYEFILVFKKRGNAPTPDKELKEKSKLTTEEWNTYFSGHWNFAGAKQDGHHAQFPEELPHRLIKMFSFVGDIVLDPFLGSGTTSLAAMNLNRNSVGYEINDDFLPVIKRKLRFDQASMFHKISLEFSDVESSNYTQRIADLPYIFKDPHTLANKIDIKKMQFGSKIDLDTPQNSTLFSVNNIINPLIMKLDTGIVIKLLGIKEKPDAYSQAMDYLQTTLRGEKVFLRFDNDKFDDNNMMLCYLYLKNKTFINLHMLKRGLVEIDESRSFQYLKKFREIAHERMA